MSRPKPTRLSPGGDRGRPNTQDTLDRFLSGFAAEPLTGRLPGVRLDETVDVPRVAGQLLRQLVTDAAAVAVVERITAVLRARVTAAEAPRWKAAAKELWWLGVVVRSFRDDAINQCAVLDAFEKAGWPPRIPDPLPVSRATNAKRRRWQTVQSLNRGMLAGAIRFSADGLGGFHWEAVV